MKSCNSTQIALHMGGLILRYNIIFLITSICLRKSSDVTMNKITCTFYRCVYLLQDVPFLQDLCVIPLLQGLLKGACFLYKMRAFCGAGEPFSAHAGRFIKFSQAIAFGFTDEKWTLCHNFPIIAQMHRGCCVTYRACVITYVFILTIPATHYE